MNNIDNVIDSWKTVRLDEIADRVVTKNKNNESDNVLTISAQYGLVNQKEFFNKIVASKNLTGYYLLNKGDFAYNKSYSNGYPLGAIKPLELYDMGVVSTLYICFRLNEKVDNVYMKHYFESSLWHKEVLSIAPEGGRSHGLLNVGTKEFFSIKLIIPSLKEQQNIADILSTVDTQIEQTGQIIEQTKELKHGLMQQLLTKGIGHREFKESNLGDIPSEWEIIKLGQLADIHRGASPRPIKDPKWFSDESTHGWIRISDVTKSNKYLLSTEQHLSQEGIEKSRSVKPGDLIMSICGTIGRPIILKMHACIHDGFVAFESLKTNKVDVEYLRYVLTTLTDYFKSQGQPGTQVNLNTAIVEKAIIALPKLEEQQKIAEILSSVDDQIDIYEKEKEKYEELKKGLMQQLLTGKIRVKVDE